MTSKKDNVRQPFNDAVHNSQSEKVPDKPEPNMIRKDQPVPIPKPPALGQAIDAQSFNRRWQQEVNAAKPLDAFDAIDAQHSGLSQQFKKTAQPDNKREQELE